MFIYQLGMPIDFYQGLTPLHIYIKIIKDKTSHLTPEDEMWYEYPTINSIKDIVHQSFIECSIRKTCWEGDIRGKEIYIGGIPTEETQCELYLIWKQGNNGTTFIATPIEFPHLEEYWIHERSILTAKNIIAINKNIENFVNELFA